jgi:hypothetical protein
MYPVSTFNKPVIIAEFAFASGFFHARKATGLQPAGKTA